MDDNLSYSEKLKHPKWQKKRLEIMQRDNFKCMNCYSTEKPLHVHHITYSKSFKNPWDYHEANLITLCEDCHNEIQKIDMNEASKYLYRIFLIMLDTEDRLSFLDKLSEDIRYYDKHHQCTEKEAFKLSLLKLIRKL